METKQTYNGWKNYETWAVALWMDNEQGTADAYRERAQKIYANAETHYPFTKEENAILAFSEALKEEYEENTPTSTGVYADLLNAALSEVNWYEIAKHYIDELEK